jgi:hypothetical protein
VLFIEASELFENDGKLKLSAQCLYSAKQYEQALVLYEKIELWK